jgi:hypothetical protein
MMDPHWCIDSVVPRLRSGLGFNTGTRLRAVGDPLETRELEGFAVPWLCQLGDAVVIAC